MTELLDRNRTTWQRIQDRVQPELGREIADRIATLLLPYVVAEKAEASRRARALVPFLVLDEVRIMDGQHRCTADVATTNDDERAIGGLNLERPIGHSHAPSVSRERAL